MSALHLVDTPASRARLTATLENSPPHMRPVLTAVRDHHVALMCVGPSAHAFQLPRNADRPAIVMIGDDFDRAVGPAGFHLPSVRRVMRSSHSFAVVSCEPLVEAYTMVAATAAIARQNTLLVETRPEQEIAWLTLIQKLAPGRFILLATVRGGYA